MNTINEFFSVTSSLLWGWPMIILLLGTHLFLTIRLHFPQRHILKAIRLSVQRDPDATGDVSQFSSLATALAATIGTGNIIGVATAIALGGPGAVLWCWLTGVFGIATKYAEGLLAIKYREKKPDGKVIGGPMFRWRKDWDGVGQQFSLPFSLPSPRLASAIRCKPMPLPHSLTKPMTSHPISQEQSSAYSLVLLF